MAKFDETYPRVALKFLKSGSVVFQQNEPRTKAFKIIYGLVGTFQCEAGRSSHSIRLFSSGDYVGLGRRDRYVETAKAITDVMIVPLHDEDMDKLIESDDRANQHLADAVEREFEYAKHTAISRSSTPAECLASFLAATSAMNEREGRKRDLIADPLRHGIVPELLNIDYHTLERALEELDQAGVISIQSSGEVLVCDDEGLAQYETIPLSYAKICQLDQAGQQLAN